MLNELYKKENNEYVTHDDLTALIKELTNITRLQGEPGKDAVITPKVVKQVLDLATPIHGVHYRDGKDGVDGKTIIRESVIPGEELIKRISEADTQLRIPFSALEEGNVLLETLNGVIRSHNDLTQFSSHSYDEYVVLRDKIQAIDIQFQQGKGGGGATVVEINPSDIPIVTDIADDDYIVFTDTSDGDKLKRILKSDFCESCQDDVEVTGCVIVDENGVTIVDENGDPIAPENCTGGGTTTEDGPVILAESGETILDEDGNAIIPE